MKKLNKQKRLPKDEEFVYVYFFFNTSKTYHAYVTAETGSDHWPGGLYPGPKPKLVARSSLELLLQHVQLGALLASDVKDAPVDGVGGEEDGNTEEHEEGEVSKVDDAQVAHALPALVDVDPETCRWDNAVQYCWDWPDQHNTRHIHLNRRRDTDTVEWERGQTNFWRTQDYDLTQTGRSHQQQEEQMLGQPVFKTNKQAKSLFEITYDIENDRVWLGTSYHHAVSKLT